jgi:hypothetical protein
MLPPPRLPLPRAIAGLLAFAAIVHLGYQLAIGLDPTDVGPFETVLAQAVAGHFEPGVGPGGFYGPFEGENHSVLMHAPLYYRLVALAAWPAVALGAEPLAAVLYAGRWLAFLGTALALASAAGLARLDGSGRRAGWLAAALLAASPILGNLAAMLRPDALGVGLQTFGALLVLGVLREPTPWRPGRRLALAYAAMALAFCAKQQNLTVGALSTLLLGLAWLKGRVRLGPIAAGLASGAAVVALDLAAENALTGGRMFESVFVYPGGPFRAINYAGWAHVASIFDITARRSVGLIALGIACAWGLRRDCLRGGPDVLLRLFLGLELAALVPLCLYNAGAAYNYALQAVVFACILAARGLDRLLAVAAERPARLAPAAAAMVVLVLADVRLVAQTESARKADRATLRAMLADAAVAGTPAESRYFVGRHHLNRLFGRAELIHDDWLYGAFERIDAAEPRDGWLRSALTDGPVRQVVVPGEAQTVPGVGEPLPELGYRQVARHGDLHVWQRR